MGCGCTKEKEKENFIVEKVCSLSCLNKKKAEKKKVTVNKATTTKIPKYIQKYIYKQKESCVCKIKVNNSFGTGFFCNIPFLYEQTFLPVLITNNHVLGSNDINPNNYIYFSINDEINSDDSFKILIGDRLTFTDPSYDITIIELKKNDGLRICGLEVDYEELNAPLVEFRKMQVYLIHYPKSKKVCKSVGEIIGISNDDQTIKHSCNTEKGSSGCPIINLKNLKVVGIHKGGMINQNVNLGTFIKEPIEKFNASYSALNIKPQRSFLKYVEYKKMEEEEEENHKKKVKITNDKCLIFMSSDQKDMVAIPCSGKYTYFADLEKQLYEIFPKYKDLNVYFLVNGLVINRFKTINENKIKNNDKIIFYDFEDI